MPFRDRKGRCHKDSGAFTSSGRCKGLRAPKGRRAAGSRSCRSAKGRFKRCR